MWIVMMAQENIVVALSGILRDWTGGCARKVGFAGALTLSAVPLSYGQQNPTTPVAPAPVPRPPIGPDKGMFYVPLKPEKSMKRLDMDIDRSSNLRPPVGVDTIDQPKLKGFSPF